MKNAGVGFEPHTHDMKIVLTTPEVVGPENISLSWMSFNETYLVTHDSFNETIDKAEERTYKIVLRNGTPEVIPEFSLLLVALIFTTTLTTVSVYRRKRKIHRSRDTSC